MNRILISSFLFVFSFGCIYAQDDAIFTDRPGQTDAIQTMGKGYFQIESGFFFSRESDIGTKDNFSTAPNVMVKYGIIDRVELKLFLDHFVVKSEDPLGTTSDSGFGPIAFGAKVFLFEANGGLPAASLSAKFSIPNTGKNNFQHDEINPSIRLNLENSLSDNMSLSYSIGGDWGDNGFSQTAYTFVIGNSFSDIISGWAEIFGTFSNDTDDTVALDFGIGYLLSDYLQLDSSLGIGLNDPATDIFFNVGVSWKTNFLNK